MNTEQLWQQFHDPLVRFVNGRVPDPAIAEDIVQDVFMKIWKHLNTLKDQEKVHAWIYNITRNAIHDYYRRRRPAEELPLHLEAEEAIEEPDLSKELAACLRPMIDQLPDKYREAIHLTEWHGLSQKELSEKLGLSYSGAKSRVQRGREKLKELLDACCHIEADRYGNIIDYKQSETAGQPSCGKSCPS